MPSSQITARELASLSRACVANAEDLLADAELLLNAGRSARAHALATLALEELGKHQMCVSAVARLGLESGYEKLFWRSFRSHTGKLQAARLILGLLAIQDIPGLSVLVESVEEQSRTDQVQKLRGLYVDYDAGTIYRPAERVTQEVAERLVSELRPMIAVTAQVFNGKRDYAELLEHMAERVRQNGPLISESDGPAVLVAFGLVLQRLLAETSDAEGDEGLTP